jgi:hypothetical protein
MLRKNKRINDTCIVFLIIILVTTLCGCAQQKTLCKDASKYPAILTEYPNLHTGYIVFPEAIPDSIVNNVEFYYYVSNDFLDPTAEIVLRCNYSDVDFSSELDRLESLVKTSPTGDKPILKDDGTRFSVPAYIAEYAENFSYEYAVVTGQREITYVYLSFRYPDEIEAVPVTGVPLDYESYHSRDGVHKIEPKGSYNIYEFLSVDKDGHSIRCISYTDDDWPVN